jgi:WD40 repeat protein
MAGYWQGSGGEDGVRFWSVADRREVNTVFSRDVPVWAVALSRNGKFLAAGRYDGTVEVWDITHQDPLPLWPSPSQKVRDPAGDDAVPIIASIAFSPDSKTLATGSYDSTVRLWEVTTGRELTQLGRHTNHVRSVAFSPDGKLLASASDDGTVRLWDVANRQPAGDLPAQAVPVWCVSFNPEGNLLATGSLDRTIDFGMVRSANHVEC